MGEGDQEESWLADKGRVPDDRRGVVLVRVPARAKPQTDMTKSPPVAFHSLQLAAYSSQLTARRFPDVTRPASASSTPASIHARPALTCPAPTR
jgi:hypothetical protein